MKTKGKADGRARRALVDVQREVAEAAVLVRAANRTCDDCNACNRAVLCGWRQGVLPDVQRPDLLGLQLQITAMPVVGGTGTVDAMVWQEVYPGAWRTPDAQKVVYGLVKQGRLCLVADPAGAWSWIGGPVESIRAVAGPDAVSASATGILTARLVTEAPDAPA